MPKKVANIEHTSDEEIDDTEHSEGLIKSKKLSNRELFESLSESFNNLISIEGKLSEKEKEYQQAIKDIQTEWKKELKVYSGYFKRFEKIYKGDLEKQENKKKRDTTNAGKGGFNKKAPVPEVLRAYLELEETDEYSRPEITNLLNTKLKESGLYKTKKEVAENGKEREIKIIVLDKATAKKLGRKADEEIRSKDIQTFIKSFYTAT
jgi:hypothetical protein